MNEAKAEAAQPLNPDAVVAVPDGKDETSDEKLKPRFRESYSNVDSQKNMAKGLLNVTLLAANASQMKMVFDHGSAYKYFYPLVVLLTISIILQLGVAMLLLRLRVIDIDQIFEDKDEMKRRKLVKLNAYCTGFVFWIMAVNVFITGFGLGTPHVEEYLGLPEINNSGAGSVADTGLVGYTGTANTTNTG